MLPPDVETLVRDSIDVYLKAQGFTPPTFGQRLLAQSFAGQVIQPTKVSAAAAKEIQTVSIGLVTAIRNVIDNVQIAPYDTLQDDLLQMFDSEFNKCADAIRKFGVDTLKRLSPSTSASGWFDQRLEDARKARHLDLKLLAARVAKSDVKNTKRIVYNSKNEPVGVVEPEN